MKPERCPHCKRRYKRSGHQNARLWSLYHAMADHIRPLGVAYSPDSWHLWSKSKFLGCDDVTLPSGKTISIPRSTADLDVAEFNDYMGRVEAFANERGAFLEDAEFAE